MAKKTLTPAEQKLQDYLDSPAVREQRAREALEAAIKRDSPAPEESTLTPAEQMLRDFYEDPKRREEKAKKALEDAQYREAEGPPVKADNRTDSEKKLADFYSDPDRREEKAKEALEAARKREAQDKREALPGFKPGQAAGAAIGGVMNQVVEKFKGIIGPAAVLGQILNSAISGFGVLNTAVKVVASAIAPVLLPATLGLSTVFLALADVIAEHQGFIERMFDLFVDLIPVLETVVELFEAIADNIETLGGVIRDVSDALNVGAADLANLITGNLAGLVADLVRDEEGAEGGGARKRRWTGGSGTACRVCGNRSGRRPRVAGSAMWGRRSNWRSTTPTAWN